jgi:type II secretory pathway predicted ATPase ExeA
VGEAGTGKTTLLCTLVGLLEKRGFLNAVFTNPTLTREEFYDALLLKLQIECSSALKSRQLMALERTLLQRQAEGRRTVLIVDEGQRLSLELLEEIRLLLNIETPQHKLLNIIVAGQPELSETLAKPEMRQLKQRISCRCTLQTLSLEEIREYIHHRLIQAGLPEQQDLFSNHAIRLIYEYTQGIPRLVNSVCEAALQTGFALVSPQITPSIVEEVANDLDLIRSDRMSGISSPAQDSGLEAMISEAVSPRTSTFGREASGDTEIREPLEAYKHRQKGLGLFSNLIGRFN